MQSLEYIGIKLISWPDLCCLIHVKQGRKDVFHDDYHENHIARLLLNNTLEMRGRPVREILVKEKRKKTRFSFLLKILLIVSQATFRCQMISFSQKTLLIFFITSYFDSRYTRIDGQGRTWLKKRFVMIMIAETLRLCSHVDTIHATAKRQK